MIFSIAIDVDGQLVNGELLQQEILAAGATSCGMLVQGDMLTINASDIADEALALVVKNHDANPLAELKKAKLLAIDARTQAIIAAGFTFDAHQFSLSSNAQTNWLGLLVLQGALTWPLGITAQDDRTYDLALGSLNAFVATGMTVIATAVGSGRALKEAALDSAAKADLAAVVDSR